MKRLRRYTHYPHGMEEETQGEYICVDDVIAYIEEHNPQDHSGFHMAYEDLLEFLGRRYCEDE